MSTASGGQPHQTRHFDVTFGPDKDGHDDRDRTMAAARARARSGSATSSSTSSRIKPINGALTVHSGWNYAGGSIASSLPLASPLAALARSLSFNRDMDATGRRIEQQQQQEIEKARAAAGRQWKGKGRLRIRTRADGSSGGVQGEDDKENIIDERVKLDGSGGGQERRRSPVLRHSRSQESSFLDFHIDDDDSDDEIGRARRSKEGPSGLAGSSGPSSSSRLVGRSPAGSRANGSPERWGQHGTSREYDAEEDEHNLTPHPGRLDRSKARETRDSGSTTQDKEEGASNDGSQLINAFRNSYATHLTTARDSSYSWVVSEGNSTSPNFTMDFTKLIGPPSPLPRDTATDKRVADVSSENIQDQQSQYATSIDTSRLAPLRMLQAPLRAQSREQVPTGSGSDLHRNLSTNSSVGRQTLRGSTSADDAARMLGRGSGLSMNDPFQYSQYESAPTSADDHAHVEELYIPDVAAMSSGRLGYRPDGSMTVPHPYASLRPVATQDCGASSDDEQRPTSVYAYPITPPPLHQAQFAATPETLLEYTHGTPDSQKSSGGVIGSRKAKIATDKYPRLFQRNYSHIEKLGPASHRQSISATSSRTIQGSSPASISRERITDAPFENNLLVSAGQYLEQHEALAAPQYASHMMEASHSAQTLMDSVWSPSISGSPPPRATAASRSQNGPARSGSGGISTAIAKHRAKREAAGLTTDGEYYVDPKTGKHYFVVNSGAGSSKTKADQALSQSTSSSAEKKSKERRKLHKKEAGWEVTKMEPASARDPLAISAGSRSQNEPQQRLQSPSLPYPNSAGRRTQSPSTWHPPPRQGVNGSENSPENTARASPRHARPRDPPSIDNYQPEEKLARPRPPALNKTGSLYSEYSYYGELPESFSPSPRATPVSARRESPSGNEDCRSTGQPPQLSPYLPPTSQAFQPQSGQQQEHSGTVRKAKRSSSMQLLAVSKQSHLTVPKGPAGKNDKLDLSAMDPNDPLVCLHMGIDAHEQGNLEKSAILFEKSARQGCGLGMLMYGLTLRHGWGCVSQPELGFQYLQQAAESVVHNLDRVVGGEIRLSDQQMLEQAAKSELVLSIYELGQCFLRGWGTQKDKKTALAYFELAANLGDPDAQMELGFCYSTGRGSKKDLKKAAKYYRLAEKQGYTSFGMQWIHKSKYDD